MEQDRIFPVWIWYFCSVMSEKIGHKILPENVHSDELGWKYYIPSCGLLPELPLLISDEEGQIHTIISTSTYNLLEDFKLQVEEFVEKSFWHCGYYRGGCDVFKAIFWQPVEEEKETGKIIKEKVEHFFNQISKKEMTPKELKKLCPRDDRRIYAEEVKKLIFARFGFAVNEVLMYDGAGMFTDTVIIKPSNKLKVVDVYLPYQTLQRLLYYPGIIDCEHLASCSRFRVGRRFSGENEASTERIPLDCEEPYTFCTTFWRDLRWYNDLQS